MKKQIPNIITLGNLFCGCMAILNATSGDLRWASVFILLGAFFDFFDGLAARALGVSGELGKQLDSLADMVTFGVAPAMIAFQLMQGVLINNPDMSPVVATVLQYLPFLLALMSAMRLAQFNIDTRQTVDFIGLNTPSNAIFWVGLPIALHYTDPQVIRILFLNPWIFALVILVFSYLLISPLRMFSLKIKSGKLSDHYWPLALVLGGVILYLIWDLQAVSLVIILYVILSLFKKAFSKA